MSGLAIMIRHDLRMQYRHGIHAAYGVVMLLYALVIATLGADLPDWLVAFLIFSDPSVLGFFFLGGLMLLEKGDGVRTALAVTPLSAMAYLASKTITMTGLAVLAVLILGLAKGSVAHWPLLMSAVVAISVFFIGLGTGFALRFKTVNAYLIGSAALLTPLTAPALLALLDPLPGLLGLLPGIAQFRLILAALGYGTNSYGLVLVMLLASVVYAALALCGAHLMLRRELGNK